MTGPGLKEAMRKTGLSRRQLRYLEECGLLGFVRRSNGRTVYEHDQVELLAHIARLRSVGALVEEAVLIGRELLGGQSTVSDERLDALAHRALAEVERNSRVAADLVGLRARRASARGASSVGAGREP
jgi:DNA-binding transcriptional MerR regulator